MPTVALRPYQEQAVVDCRRAFAIGHQGVFLVAPTGAGKTIIFSEIARLAEAKGRRVLILVPRQELLAQTVRKLSDAGVDHGVIAASRDALVRARALPPQHALARPHAPVQVAMVLSLLRRETPEPALIVVDEAHLSMAPSTLSVLKRFSAARRLGVSATPFRLDGKGFAPWFTALVETPRVTRMVADGFLVESVTYSLPGVDMVGVHVRAGEYALNEMAERFDKPLLVGDVVEHYTRLGAGRRAIIFAASVAHSKNLVRQFERAGYRAEHVDGETPDADRVASLAALAEGAVDVVCNFGVLTEGFDCPPVSYLGVARATTSAGLWIQMAGRALRPYPGKANVIIADHGGNAMRHGLISDHRINSLDGRPKRTTAHQESASVTTCASCLAVYVSSLSQCPRCGIQRVVTVRKPIQFNKGELERLDREARLLAPPPLRSCPDHIDPGVWARLERIRQERGYKPGWSYVRAKLAHAARSK